MARRKIEKDGGGKLYGAFAIHGQRYAKDATVSSTRGDKVEGRIENRVGRSLTEKRAAAHRSFLRFGKARFPRLFIARCFCDEMSR